MCYEINKEKFRFGHCQREKDHISFHQSVISGFSCFGIDEHSATELTDVGRVIEGLYLYCFTTASRKSAILEEYAIIIGIAIVICESNPDVETGPTYSFWEKLNTQIFEDEGT
ncbi:disintegrin and metalloproteinase domain-containing protein 21 [Cricetulus griseus]|uniref:Disintegrin and metalloproteinase domain-containing protein 21 n=1 Tax=Cricetulus griseus TaxID=10029 RepID=A0A061I6A4_CRIGR|nr:disintegrin and metalloproteinase domain-containing protein 21 [Cricetulus griseus]